MLSYYEIGIAVLFKKEKIDFKIKFKSAFKFYYGTI